MADTQWEPGGTSPAGAAAGGGVGAQSAAVQAAHHHQHQRNHYQQQHHHHDQQQQQQQQQVAEGTRDGCVEPDVEMGDALQQGAAGGAPGGSSRDTDDGAQHEQQQQQVQWPAALLGRPQQQQQGQQGQPELQAQSMHHGGSFKTYMAHKNLKLAEQFEMQAFAQQPRSSLFAGVSIHVNGLTNPTHGELKQLMALHGGRFETYFHRSRVTHFICSNLPDTHLKKLAHARDPVPVVQPDWIVASLRAGQLLPVKDFLLRPMRDMPGQRTLFDHRSHAAAAVAPTELYPALAESQQQQQQQQTAVMGPPPQQQPQQPLAAQQTAMGPPPPRQLLPAVPAGQQQQQVLAVGAAAAAAAAGGGGDALANAGTSAAAAAAGGGGGDTVVLAGTAAAAGAGGGGGDTVVHAGTAAAAAGGGGSVGVLSPTAAAAAADRDQAKAQATAASLRAACDLLKGPPKTTADDPQGFVGSFFKSSRLHFIGSWKSRVEALMVDHYQQQQQQQQQQAAGGGPQHALLFGAGASSSGSSKQGKGAAGAAAAAGGRQQQQQQQRVIVHIDMDCFFAAVSTVGRPEFAGKPLAVCHSASAQGSGEVSAANYEARAFGVKAGQMIADAKGRCPGLLVVPYEFEKYEEASLQVYRILLRHSPVVQPLSVDEAYLDLTPLLGCSSGGVASEGVGPLVGTIRREIAETTGCTASAGIGPNMLLARLATKRAKPNGQSVITPQEARGVLGDLPVGDLPGVGWALRGKLADMGITHVRQVWSSSKEVLCRRLGAQTGASLWQHAHGLDERPVALPKARRSVGAEVNWGVRFSNAQEADAFLKELCGEVSSRLAAAGARAKSITLKLKRRQQGAPEPAKFLGHGACDNLSRSVTLGRYVCSAGELYSQAASLLAGLRVPVEEIRGVGITASKLDSEPGSRDARPSAPQPAKLPPSKHGVFDASKHPWLPWVVPKVALDAHNQQQQQQVEGRSPAGAAGSGGGVKRKHTGDAAGAYFAAAAASPAAAAADRSPEAKRLKASAAVAGGLAAAAAAAGGDCDAAHTAGVGGGRTFAAVDGHTSFDPEQQSEDFLDLCCSLTDASQPDDAAALAAAAAAAEGGLGQEQEDGSSPSAKRRLFGQGGQERQQQQQEGEEEELGETGQGAAAAAAAGGGRSSSGVLKRPAATAAAAGDDALPPADQLDPEVLAALPPELRRELEAAYSRRSNNSSSSSRHGVGAAQQQQRGLPPPAARRGAVKRPRHQQHHHHHHHQQQQQQQQQQQLTFARQSTSPTVPPAAAAGGGAGVVSPNQAAAAAAGGPGNWLARVGEAAAAAKRQKQQRQQQQHWGFVGGRGPAAVDRAAAGPNRSRPPHQLHPSELLVTLDQVDPEVLAQLPKELQQELRAALPGRPRALANKGHAGGGLAGAAAAAAGFRAQAGGEGFARLCSQDPDSLLVAGPPAVGQIAAAGATANGASATAAQGDEQSLAVACPGQRPQQQWHWQHVGLGRLFKQQQQQQQQVLFAEEPAAAVLSALQTAVRALAGAGSAGQHVREPTATLPAGDGMLSASSNSDTEQEQPAAAAAEAAAAAAARQKCAVLGELTAQWLVSQSVSDLGSVRKMLRGVVDAGEEVEGFREVAVRVVGAVQRAVQQRYGFTVALAG